MRTESCGERHVMVDLDGLSEAMALYGAVRDARIVGVTDAIPAARTVLVEFDPEVTTAQTLTESLRRLVGHPPVGDRPQLLTISVRYDGADLDFVCDRLSMSRNAFVAWHTGQRWTMAFSGFAPGFGYLVRDGGWPPIPRLAVPRVAVPAGSVAMAGEFTGLYPRESPGGWQLIGRTAAILWDVHRMPPAILLPGMTVQFTESA